MHAQSLSHVRLCNPMDCSLPDSSVHGIFQVRILEWVAISFTNLIAITNLILNETFFAHISWLWWL